MFANGLLECFSSSAGTLRLVVVYSNKIKTHDFEHEHTHEEADTLIPNQVLVCLAERNWSEIKVWSPHTDVLTLLVDLVENGHLRENVGLKFLTGRGPKQREIDVVKQVAAVGFNKC